MQQTFIPNPTHYTPDEFRKLISSIQPGAWRPKFPTLHNTGVPSLAQWKAYGPTPQQRWGSNLNQYYKGLGWHAGPHFVCCPDYIWYLSDLRFDGVSVSCWNSVTVGIEMVGNYEVGSDDFASGDGAKVGNNAAFVLAVLCEKFGWKLDNYVRGVSGLHFHKECTADHHACPGSKVSKPKMIAAANAQLATLVAHPLAPPAPAPVAAAVPAPPAPAPAKGAAPDIMSVEDIQSALNQLGASPQLNVTGDYDQATKAAVTAFQKAHNCDVDGWVGPQTTSAIQAALAQKTAPDIMSVEDIQSALNTLGANPELDVNGDYDQATKAAVASFQGSHNCGVDGWVGPQTTAAIKAALAAT